ncbi:serine hydrolase domain-containing protein [Brachybacterium sacelli]|uniref:CubicO group peptidase (Beta-lactamase class C family) n=1 Tax=Brachybacterium sacelli TaxID=173364 RepID=A0ABS4WYR2_9MICO|nr:serine hydrolase domain-containing protein [Brachybacterium sacelli]MBP2381349.1 CubicO group peptidase (beta-lactamase class C family) [Brachybacterium sacelli]
MSTSAESTASTAGEAVTVREAGGLPGDLVERLTESFRGHVAAGEGGMAFSVYRAGEPLLQLHGGMAAEGRPWSADTLAVLFSGTKGLTATLAAMVTGRGQLDPDAPIAEYWPEFAARGKVDARVHHVLDHTIGLPYVDPDPVDQTEAVDNILMAERLAAQPTLWEPGTKVAYHALTYGYLMAEILRRATGSSVGTLLRTELAEPYDLDVHLGLPEAEEARVAPVFRSSGYRISTFLEDDPARRAVVDRMYGNSLTAANPPFNTRAHHAAELAAGGGIGSADAMAKLYSLLIAPDALDAPIVPAETLARATRTWSEGDDVINDRPVRFGLGFELDDPIGSYGPVRPAFGHSGAGGGLHGAWPEKNLAFSFLPCEMRSEDVDRRVKELLGILAEG